MAIVKMKHLRLVAMARDRDELLLLLQRLGCVEIDEPSVDREDPVWADLSSPDSGRLSSVRERYTEVERALGVLQRYVPEKNGFLQPRPGLTEEQLFDTESTRASLEAAEELNNTDRRITTIHAEQLKLETQKAALAPWLGLDLPLETESTDQVTIQFGVLPTTIPFEQAEGAVQAAGDLTQLTLVSADQNQQYCLLVCHSSQSEAVLDALKGLGWSRSNLRDWTGTAADNTARLDRELEALAQELAELEEKLAGMGGLRLALKQLSDHLAAEVSREESRSRMLDTSQTFFLEGWVPAESWPKLEQALAPYPCAYETADPVEEEYPQVPVQLKNNLLTKPLNMVTEMYSLPAYGSLDPNPLMAPFFILFYGIMMADMGYGLVMMLAGALVLKKKRPGGTMGHLCGLLVWCGMTTFLFGALTGGFFGDFIPKLVEIINPDSTFALPALFTPVNDTLPILIGSLALGLIQIITGMAISFIRKLRDGQVLDALWEEVTWWVILAGLALTILGITNILLILGGVLLLAGCIYKGVQKGGGPVKIVLNALLGLGGSLYNNITGYFQDILSYSRLMALMLSGAVVAQVFNTLGAIPGNVIFFVIISMIGNALNFALNLLGCYVHDMRLQCLEYFNRFYQDGGKPFRPLDLNTKYYDVVK